MDKHENKALKLWLTQNNFVIQFLKTEIFSVEKTNNGYPKREKKSGLEQKWKVSTVDIRIKKSGLKFIHSKVPSSGLTLKILKKIYKPMD